MNQSALAKCSIFSSTVCEFDKSMDLYSSAIKEVACLAELEDNSGAEPLTYENEEVKLRQH
jgi:hypothetical protein